MRKTIQWIFALAAAVTVITAGGGCSQKSQKARTLERAERYYKDGQYEKAEIEYRNVLRVDQENGQAMGRLGMILYEEGRIAQAAPILNRATQLATNNLDARVKLAMVYMVASRPKEAKEHAIYVLERRPDDEEVPLLLAEISLTPADVEDTKQRLQRLSVPTSKRGPAEAALGTLFLRQTNFMAAEAAFKRAQALSPKLAALYSGMAVMYAIQKDMPQAEEALKNAADLSPLRSPRRLKYAQLRAQKNDIPTARTYLQEIVNKAPDYLPAWLELARFSAAEQKFDDANSYLEKLLVRDPDNFDGLMLRANIKLARNQWADAATELENLLKIYPRSQVVYYQLAKANMYQGQAGKAIGRLEQALSLPPEFLEASIMLAELQTRRNDPTSAIIGLKRLLQKHPDVVRAQFLLAEAYRLQGSLPDSLAIYSRLAAKLTNSWEVSYLMGAVYRQQGQKAEARKAFTRAQELTTNTLQIVTQLVQMDLEDKQYASALQRVEQQIARDPKSPDPLLLEATVFLYQQRTNDAERVLRSSLDLKPDFRPAYMELAKIYEAASLHDKAMERLQGIVSKSPQDIVAWMLIGTIQGQLKDYTSARETYEKILKINPNFSPALNNVAYLYSEQFGQHQQAYEAGRKARELQPYEPATEDTFGWVNYKRGDYRFALSLLQESASKLPDEPEVALHLGMAHYMVGEEAAATKALKQATDSKAEFAGKDEARRRLTVLAIDAKKAGPEVRAQLEKIVADHPDDPVALVRLGALQERDGAYDKARMSYEAALKVSPEDVTALVALARVLAEHLQQLEKGFGLAKTANKLEPDDPEVSHTLGRLAYKTGDHNWALNLLQETVRKRSNDPGLLYDFAEAAYSVGRVVDAVKSMQDAAGMAGFTRADDAKKFLEIVALADNPAKAASASARIDQVLKADPEYLPALLARAEISEQTSNVEAAKQAYEKVLKSYPDFLPAKKRLAIILADDPASRKRAYDLAIQARDAFPNDAELGTALGILDYYQGNYQRAADLLKQSATARSTDGKLQFYLGMAQYKLGRKAESKSALQMAIKLNAPDALKSDANKLLNTELK